VISCVPPTPQGSRAGCYQQPVEFVIAAVPPALPPALLLVPAHGVPNFGNASSFWECKHRCRRPCTVTATAAASTAVVAAARAAARAGVAVPPVPAAGAGGRRYGNN
jgi:hypothetical protein